MTTAHRATWKAARGGLQEEGSFRLHAPSVVVSAKDAPTERMLKKRELEALNPSRDEMRSSIQDGTRTKKPRRSRFGPVPAVDGPSPIADATDPLNILASREADVNQQQPSDTGKDVANDALPYEDGVQNQSSALTVSNKIASLHQNDDHPESDEDSEEEDDESDEDEGELLAELERIRKEREFSRAKKQAEQQEQLEREETAKASIENPLLNTLATFNDEISETASIATGSVPAFAVRRRWDDDVVFRNQARGERKQAPRFVNDTIGNDFHRRFMKQYMR